jgi:hypothetical protein
MVEGETLQPLHLGSLTSRVVDGPHGDPTPVGKTMATPTLSVPHGYTLRFLIVVIKNSQQKSRSQQIE